MAALQSEWDPRKDAENQRKHRISFSEARTVFADEYALLLDDPTTPPPKIGSFCLG